MFNQLTLTCAFVDEAIPCKHASQFQYLNEVIHKPAEPFLTDADVTSGVSYYSNRIMSDGARARAFEDSKLMAQIGGGQAVTNNFIQATSSSFTASNPNDQPSHQSLPAIASVDVEDNSYRANNFIESGFLPSENFQPLFNGGQQVAHVQPQPQPQPSPRTNGRADLIENHAFQLEHSSPTPSASSNQQTSPSQASSLVVPTASVETSGSNQSLDHFTAPPSVQHENSPTTDQANSFGFSISTNHQFGAPAEPTQSFTQHQQPNLQAQQQQQLSPAVLSNQFGSRPVVSTTTTEASEPVTTTTATTQSQPLIASSFATQTGPSLPPTTTTPTVINTATSPSQAIAEPQPLAPLAPTTQYLQSQLATTTAATFTERQPAQLRHRQDQSRQAQRNRAKELHFERTHIGFQSTRLNSQASKPQSARSSDTPLVMRRQANNAPVPLGAANGPSPTSPQSLEGQLWSGNDFWRRSFDAQLMAPKFESLLTRRRV